jgi:uncharacterized membrane protein
VTEADKRRGLRLGLEAEPPLRDLAERVAGDLEERLRQRFPGIEWTVEVIDGSVKDPQARITELVSQARQTMLDGGLDLAICLTEIPLRLDGRPLTVQASATDGVAVVSVPALGPVDVERRVVETTVNAVAALVGKGDAADSLDELASPLGTARVQGDGTIRFTGAAVKGNLRLLLGMVRANRPWRFAAKLSRVVVAALGTASYVLASASFWMLADHMSWQRLLALSVGAVAITSTAVIAAHDLWERSLQPQTRERVILFNAVTTLTVVIGVLSLYAGLAGFSVAGVFSLLPQSAVDEQLGRDAGAAEYLKLAWLSASLATLAGALGSLISSDLAVRDAAYAYWSTEDD